MNESTRRALPALFALGGMWGGSFLFIKVLVDETGPLEVVLGRLFFGTLAVGTYMVVARRGIKASPLILAQASVLAVIGNMLPFGLIAWGEEHISSGTASILNATVPIFTAAFAAAILDEETFTPPRLAGLLLGFLGVGVLTGEDVLDITDSSVLGELAIVGAASCYGLTAVYARNLLRGQDPVNLSILQLALATVFTVPILLLVTGGSPNFHLSLEATASVLALGIGGTGAGYVVYFWLIENIGSVRASLVTYIVPVIAVVLGAVVLDETVGVNTVAGGLLIVAGVASVMRGAAPTRKPMETPVEAAPVAIGD